ncbi:MAG: PrsW family intramembrane metalloprotease [Candidatus Lokiarchaeota archaeon]|nr:PrsW family intramembrane metalloprotease [Candidatus Lokiarchaeota archaeon]
MSEKNPYKPYNIKLTPLKKIIWTLLLIGNAIYAILMLIFLLFSSATIEARFALLFTYIILGPLLYYALWILLYYWKSQKWPHNKKIYGSEFQYFIFFILLGVCVINWSAYWNTGIDTLWLVLAIIYYVFSNDQFGTSIIYQIGSSAITPALVEEFNKSLPSILAFFVVLQRGKNPNQKNKGFLNNELKGMLIGILIGVVFESIETASYVVNTILAGGTDLSVYLQVTVRNWAPIHILGGSLGGFAAGRAERLRFQLNEEELPFKEQLVLFLKRFLPIWAIPVIIHFLWNSSSIWIYLIFLGLNIDSQLLYLVSVIVFQVILALLSFFLILFFFRIANKKAKESNRCPQNGVILSNKSDDCEPIKDVLESKTQESLNTKEKKTELRCPNCNMLIKGNFNYCTNCGEDLTPYITLCPNCGNYIKKNSNFCIYCGINLNYSREAYQNQLYTQNTHKLLKYTLIISILFGLVTLGLFGLFLIISPILALVFFFTQNLIELISVSVIIYAVYLLKKLKEEYNGKKSIWGWLFLTYNLIGMIFGFLFYGSGILIDLALTILSGESANIIFLFPYGLGMIIGAILLIYPFKKTLEEEPQVLQYQRWF